MKAFVRHYEQRLGTLVQPGKVLVLYGPRRVGKTFLIQTYLQKCSGRVYSGVGEDRDLCDVLESRSLARIHSTFKGYDIIFIDEAQKVDRIGEVLKLMVDNLPETSIIATGSSSFDLAHQMGEPLTGRQRLLKLYPVSMLELNNQFGGMFCNHSLESCLIYGSYPEVMNLENNQDKREYLLTLRDAYLYKDLLELDSVRNSRKIGDLLRLVAFQIGKQVSLSELATQVGLNKQTVERYLDLLEKSFVLINVGGFSRNLRKEISKSSRYYFWDNGVVNALINNFNLLSCRNDIGMLWENFLFTERLKRNTYLKNQVVSYFWRTYDQQEIDLVEEDGNNLNGYEFKYKPRKCKVPAAWRKAYLQATYDVISRENYLSFIAE